MTTAKTTPEDLNTLHEQRKQIQSQILTTTTQIRNVVIRDLPRFLERETRWRWVRHIDFASEMTDDQITAIKAGLRTLNARISPLISEQLDNDELWISADTPVSNNDKSLALNTKIWAALQSISSHLSAFLTDNGFPDDPDGTVEQPFNLQYRTPTYFLDGHYCPRLIETYWSHIAHLNRINEEIQTIHNEAARLSLETRWNTVQG